MNKTFAVLAALVALVLAIGVGSASAAANERASCNAIGVSAHAGDPGSVAEITLFVHRYVREVLGLPPGTVDSYYARVHAGSVELCFPA